MDIEESLLPRHETITDPSVCTSCKQNPPLEGYANALCRDCREAFIRYPIPKWIKLFALGVLAVMVIGLIRTPKYFSLAYHLAKAENAMDSNKFETASRELQYILSEFPNNAAVNGKMLIASSYNHDLVQMQQAFLKVNGVKFEDEDLLKQMETAMAYVTSNLPQDSLMAKKILDRKDNADSLKALSASIFNLGGTDINAYQLGIANELYDLGDYKASEEILLQILKTAPDYYGAISLLSAIKRETGKFDEAISLCNKMLYANAEDIYAIGQKVRIELKRNGDMPAAKLARKAMSINPLNTSAMEAQAMVDFFAGNKTRSLALLASIKRQEAIQQDYTISQRLEAIINGTTKYR